MENADYMADAQGRMVPKSMVKDIDLLRDATVARIVEDAKAMSASIAEFKTRAFADVQAFIDLSAERFGVKMGGNKGNVTLMSFDGKYKVIRAVAERLNFDERLQIAKELIDDCIKEWGAGSRPEIMALVNQAFMVDKEGRVSTTRILGLRKLDITADKWRKAMDAITESIQVASSKSYIRIYERVGLTDRYDPVSLDVANV